MTPSPAIHLQGYVDIAGAPLFAPIDLTMPGGAWTCILGRSGAGKSTLLRVLAGLDGGGRFNGDISASDGAPLRGRVSLIAQADLLLPWLSVLENTVLGPRLRGEKPDMARARSMIEDVGLGGYLSAKPEALSGGMRQRVSLARSLMEDRPIALLDEPFSALDASTRAAMQELAARMLHGKTVVMVTHDPAEAARLGHQIIVLSGEGARHWPVPQADPVRDPYAPQTIACQAGLLDHLRGRA